MLFGKEKLKNQPAPKPDATTRGATPPKGETSLPEGLPLNQKDREMPKSAPTDSPSPPASDGNGETPSLR